MRGFCIRMEFCFTKESKDGCETTTSVHNSHQITSHLINYTLIFLPKTRGDLRILTSEIVHLYLLTAATLWNSLRTNVWSKSPWLRQSFAKGVLHVGNAGDESDLFRDLDTMFTSFRHSVICLWHFKVIQYGYHIYIYNMHVYNYIILYLCIYSLWTYLYYLICAYECWTLLAWPGRN